MQQKTNDSRTAFHFVRPRINQLFLEAVKYPLVVVCAGAGYGKTSAVHDFTQEYEAVNVRMQLSERDNVSARFWENYIHTIAQVNKPFAEAMVKLGFPDTKEKMDEYLVLLKELVKLKRRILVLDDFHCIQEPSVINFLEECVFFNMPPGTSVFLLSRSSPGVNSAGLVSRGLIFNISEDELRFTENEIAGYFRSIDVTPNPEHLREIKQDTGGWIFAINLIARSYQRAPGYEGYLRNAMKTDIFRLMETEIWQRISERLQCFLVQLSLIHHLSIDLIALLAEDDQELIDELERQNAYVRRDNYINAYLIHHLFLEFLSEKQDYICVNQKRKTYSVAGNWCNKNNFKIDALSYFEKIDDYEAIVSLLYSLPAQIPRVIAKYAAEIIDRIPEEAFGTVKNLASMHLAVYMCQGNWEKSIELAQHYEAKFLLLPKDNLFRSQALCAIYNCWGYIRASLCLIDHVYDFDIYFEKFCKLFTPPIDMQRSYNHCPGPWINAVGTSQKGAPEKFIASLTRTVSLLTQYFDGLKTGEDDLAWGELNFYRGDFHNAEIFIIRALEQAREFKQFEVIHRALFYSLRLSVAQGNYQKAEQALNEMKSQLEESEYINRHINYDIVLCWCSCILDTPEKAPDWLKGKFSPYSHAAFTENYANQAKAIYSYTTRNYPPILSYIQEMKKRESFLLGRIEMLAMEACIHYKTKNKKQAFAVLQEAYDTASPNDIVIPFIELGKSMRTLTSAAQKESGCHVPKQWLENINRKSASYAKYQVHIATKYRQTHHITDEIVLTPREKDVFTDLSHGLSRSEIAVNRSLSINTVKMVINNVYMKLGAENLADAIRLAAERKIV